MTALEHAEAVQATAAAADYDNTQVLCNEVRTLAVALDELVAAVEDAKRRAAAGDTRALASTMLRVTLTQAKQALA